GTARGERPSEPPATVAVRGRPTRSSPAPTKKPRTSRGFPFRVAALRPRRSAFVHRDVVAQVGANIDLPRPCDRLLLVLEHLLPLREPARGTRDGEQYREELRREAHRLVDEARVEVDVRV